MNRFLTSLLCITLLLASTGCGFRLRGSYDIPPELNQLHVASWDEYAELTKLVEDRLLLNNIVLLNEPSAEHPVLVLQRDRLQERTLSLFADGQVAEYQLVYAMQFELFVPGKESVKHDVEVVRQYQDDPNRVLAKDREKRLLVSEMRVEAADKILRILASAHGH